VTPHLPNTPYPHLPNLPTTLPSHYPSFFFLSTITITITITITNIILLPYTPFYPHLQHIFIISSSIIHHLSSSITLNHQITSFKIISNQIKSNQTTTSFSHLLILISKPNKTNPSLSTLKQPYSHLNYLIHT
jgi:hypothetical protein